MQNSAGDVQIHGSGLAVFLWGKPECSKDILNPLGLSVTRKELVYFLQHGFHLPLIAANTNLTPSL